MHLDEEQIQRVLHAELSPAAGEEARGHLAGCSECRLRVDEARREESRIFGLLGELDHPLPRIHDQVPPIRPRRGPMWGRLAASIVMGIVAAGAAYAASGAPLPRVFQRLVNWVVQTPAPNQPVTRPATAETAGRGIAVTAGDRLLIVFSTDKRAGLATIRLTDDPDVEVHTLHGQASFTSDLDRLQIDNRSDSSRFRVLIPRRAPLVEIEVGGRRVFHKEGDRVVTQARPDPRGDYLIPLN